MAGIMVLVMTQILYVADRKIDEKLNKKKLEERRQ